MSVTDFCRALVVPMMLRACTEHTRNTGRSAPHESAGESSAPVARVNGLKGTVPSFIDKSQGGQSSHQLHGQLHSRSSGHRSSDSLSRPFVPISFFIFDIFFLFFCFDLFIYFYIYCYFFFLLFSSCSFRVAETIPRVTAIAASLLLSFPQIMTEKMIKIFPTLFLFPSLRLHGKSRSERSQCEKIYYY